MRERKMVEERVRRQLAGFLLRSGTRDVEIRATTDLIKDAGLTSLQGLEFVLDLCDEFHFDFPTDFNPFVDDERRRGQTFDGLVKAIERHLASEGASNGKK
ncbi:MAG TPA: acyl carrier protein [Pirellulales bacterium]|nr:acyl carrier protein [Pirellulales bacterium]